MSDITNDTIQRVNRTRRNSLSLCHFRSSVVCIFSSDDCSDHKPNQTAIRPFISSLGDFPYRSFMSTPILPATIVKMTSSASSTTRPTIKIFATFHLPPPTLELLKSQVDSNGLGIEIITSDKDLEIVGNLRSELKAYGPFDGLICRPGNTIDSTALDLCGPSLKAISTFSVGFNHIDLAESKKRGILVGHCPDTVTHTTADTCIALMLGASRLLIQAHENVVSGRWGKTPFHVYDLAGRDLHHSTVGIIGLGRIGLAVAKRLRGFDCKILYTGRTRKVDAEKQVDAEYVTFDELLARSDFVVPQCPLNENTRHLFNRAAFAKMKPTAVFVNTTRGGVVDQDALYEALRDDKIFAAGLDVTDPEPLPVTHPLVGLPNCLIVPHIGTATKECRHETGAQLVTNLLEALLKPNGGNGIYCNR